MTTLTVLPIENLQGLYNTNKAVKVTFDMLRSFRSFDKVNFLRILDTADCKEENKAFGMIFMKFAEGHENKRQFANRAIESLKFSI